MPIRSNPDDFQYDPRNPKKFFQLNKDIRQTIWLDYDPAFGESYETIQARAHELPEVAQYDVKSLSYFPTLTDYIRLRS